MKRFTFLAVVLAVVATLAVTPPASGFGDAKGPPCADIISGGDRQVDGYVGTLVGEPATFDFSMTSAAPACAKVTYTFYVSAGGAPFTAVTGVTDGTAIVMPQQTYASAPASVCVYATSAKSRDLDVADRAPDNGCLSYVLNESPGNSSFG